MLVTSSKSSPLIEEPSKNPRSSKSSKRSSRQRDSSEYEYRKVANPLLSQEQENYIPIGLLNAVGHMEYITPHVVQNISWGQVVSAPRRSSVFAKHLQAMQRAVKEQQQKSKTLIGLKKQQSVCFQEMDDEKSVSIQENVEQHQDGVSLGMHHWFQMQPQRMENQQMMMLEEFEYEDAQEQNQVHFYSENNIQNNFQDLDDYFYP